MLCVNCYSLVFYQFIHKIVLEAMDEQTCDKTQWNETKKKTGYNLTDEYIFEWMCNVWMNVMCVTTSCVLFFIYIFYPSIVCWMSELYVT